MLFDNSIRLHVQTYSKQAVQCHVYSEAMGKYFFMSVIYASNSNLERRDLWSKMSRIKFSMPPSTPWLVFGDFNVIYHLNERSDYFDGMPVTFEVQDFQACVTATELIDIHSGGCFFTWSNKRSEGFLTKKLDRVMTNIHWLDAFSDIHSTFLPPKFSDHSTGLLCSRSTLAMKKGSFKFF